MQKQAEVAIIGGGAIGVCTAYYLWKNGVEAIVLEKAEIGSGCSYGNSGLIVPSHIVPLAAPGMINNGLKWMFNPESPFYLKPRFDLDFFSWLWKFNASCNRRHVQKSIPLLSALSRTSAQLFEELERARLFDFTMQQRGLMMLYNTAREFEADRAVAEQARQLGLQVSELDYAQIQALDAHLQTRAHGIYYHEDAHLEPAEFVRGLARYLAGKGVAMHARTEVTGLETAGNRIQTIRTSRGEFAAKEIVLAGGAWSAQLLRPLRLKLLLQAGKGYSITVGASEQKPKIPVILHEARVGITPMNGRLRFAGTMELAGLDHSINQRRVAAILKAVPAYFPGWDPLAQIASAEIWAGLRPCTPDGLPYVGRFAKYSNLIAATGHAMLGITLAPVTGQLVSEIILGKQPSIPLTALQCERFD